MADMLPPLKSVRPMEPKNSVSPAMRTGLASRRSVSEESRNRHMLPSVWPGVLMTFHGMLPIFTTSPWLTRWSTGHAGNFWSSRGTGLSPQIMSASMAEAMTVAPVRLRSSAAAAT